MFRVTVSSVKPAVEDLDRAVVVIPPPDASGYWHFTYVTFDTDGCWYGGKRSTKKHPMSDPYLGSGNWIKQHPDRKRLKRDILAFYESSEDVFSAEAAMITWSVISDDPFCMNLREGGEGMSVEDARRRSASPQWRERNTARNRIITSNPEWRQNRSILMRGLHSDTDIFVNLYTTEWRESHIAGIRRAMDTPEWKEKHLPKPPRAFAGTPEWKANLLAGIRRAVRWRLDIEKIWRSSNPPRVFPKNEHGFVCMDEMREELRRQVFELDGVNEFCRRRGIEHHASVSLALSGKRPVTEAIANACGYFAQTVFRKL